MSDLASGNAWPLLCWFISWITEEQETPAPPPKRVITPPPPVPQDDPVESNLNEGIRAFRKTKEYEERIRTEEPELWNHPTGKTTLGSQITNWLWNERTNQITKRLK